MYYNVSDSENHAAYCQLKKPQGWIINLPSDNKHKYVLNLAKHEISIVGQVKGRGRVG